MNIDSFFEQISHLQVLVVGDLMIDRYYHGNVTRVSPEAPVPVVQWVAEENRLGGAANVALNVAALGAETLLCGVVGKDQESEKFFDLMEERGLATNLMVQSANRPTTIKTRVIAAKQHLLRLDKESVKDLHEEEEIRLLERLNGLFETKKVDMVILQDYNKGVLTERVIQFILDKTRTLQIPVSVDPKLNNFWSYQHVDLFKPNLKEVQGAVPFAVEPTVASLSSAGAFLRNKLHSRLLLMTLSENGVFAKDDHIAKIFPTQKRKVADVCGAGDGVIAIAALALAAGLSTPEIALLANLVGGQIVESVGVATVDKAVLRKEIVEWQLKHQL